MMPRKQLATPLFTILPLAAVFLLGTVGAVGSASLDAASCLECHQSMFDDALFRQFIHEPFLQQKCVFCHSELEVQTAVEGGVPAGGQPGSFMPLADLPDIMWFGKDPLPALIHWFAISKDRMGSDLHAANVSKKKGVLHSEVPPFDRVETISNDNRPPVISGVEVLAIRRGVFITAMIGWQTDELADSGIVYGFDDLDLSSETEKQLLHEHRLILMGLKANRDYRFVAHSRDIFGNEAVSEAMSFSTGAAEIASIGETDDSSIPAIENLGLRRDFFRNGQDYIVRISAQEPTPLLLGTSYSATHALPVTGTPVPKGHVPLKEKRASNMGDCYTCHERTRVFSHPVNVLPKAGMAIPPEYPTLPDGRISCMSCHSVHSSEYPYRTIKNHERELCLGCHKNLLDTLR